MERIQETLDSFLDWLEREGKSVICYGASAMAEEALREDRLASRVQYFVDSDTEKQGELVRLADRRFPVHSPAQLRQEDFSRTVLLITSGWFRTIMEELDHWPELAEAPCAAYPQLLIACAPDSEEFFRRRILDECLREYESVLENRGEPEPAQKWELLAEKRAYIQGNGPQDRPLVIPRVMILPTTRCNLRCKGCSSLLPLFERPVDLPAGQLIRDLDLFFRGVDQCIRLTIGGEPFLYPELVELLAYLRAQDKILGVLLITNSTIQPGGSVLELLKDPKFYVEVSDYGHIRQMSRTVAALESAGVRFSVLADQVWDDMGGVEPRGRTAEQQREVYCLCEQSRLMKSIHNGAVYTCARSARMRALACGYSSERDYFVLNEGETIECLREKIRGLYYMDTADACDRCDLGRLPAKKIPAGVQLAGHWERSAYTLVKRDEYEALKAAGKKK